MVGSGCAIVRCMNFAMSNALKAEQTTAQLREAGYSVGVAPSPSDVVVMFVHNGDERAQHIVHDVDPGAELL